MNPRVWRTAFGSIQVWVTPILTGNGGGKILITVPSPTMAAGRSRGVQRRGAEEGTINANLKQLNTAMNDNAGASLAAGRPSCRSQQLSGPTTLPALADTGSSLNTAPVGDRSLTPR